jgi:YVTN family beta-propeller protein
MNTRIIGFSSIFALTCATAGIVAACGDDPVAESPKADAGTDVVTADNFVPTQDTGTPDTFVPTGPVAKGPSKSSTIALSDDGKLVVMVNPEADNVTVFKTADNTVSATVTTGKEPSSVVIAPDGVTAYVANRADATVVKITGLDTATPTVSAPVNVGSEPTGIALSPTGAKLYVAEWAESRVSVIDTKTMSAGASVAVKNPRGLAVTNNGNTNDSDETVVVTEFYGEPIAGKEAQDDGRRGRVRLLSPDTLAETGSVGFDPYDSGMPKTGGGTVTTSPNQLWAVAIADTRFFVPTVSVSAGGVPKFSENVFAGVLVGNLTTKAADTTAAGTTNLTKKIIDKIPTPSPTAPRFTLGDIVDLGFVPGTNISYVASRGASVIQRVVWDAADVTVGSTQNAQIDVNVAGVGAGPCQEPSGIVVASPQRAYVNCWSSQRLGVLDLQSQALLTTVKSTERAVADTAAVARGRHFYFTGRGAWSNAGSNGAKGGEGWSSCGSCHPDAMSDNVTWSFGAGPRQTTSQDGSFSHGAGAQKQRIFNWTGIFDEHHDFERNTRNVSGGLGLITTAADPADCAALDKQTPLALGQTGLGKPVKESATDTVATPTLCVRTDWDDIDAFIRTVRPPRGKRFPAAGTSAAAGATVFTDLGCNKCHGGQGWTLSRRAFEPSTATNADLAANAFVAPAGFVSTWSVAGNKISAQPAAADNTGADIAPPQVRCVLRSIGTFGIPSDATATDALERKDNGSRAQGAGGYNIPSLYGLAVGAPYLHHGQATSLEALFTDAKWVSHTQAGAANPPTAQQVKDLVTYLLSIDATTSEVAPPATFDGCE